MQQVPEQDLLTAPFIPLMRNKEKEAIRQESPVSNLKCVVERNMLEDSIYVLAQGLYKELHKQERVLGSDCKY